MSARVYYNERDPAACEWLRELMDKGLIPKGAIDERSIAAVQPEDLSEYTQCHFFAGIGGWAYALRLAGVPDLECWTGSCPCQPFSGAGKKLGMEDDRHLWPEFFRLIAERRPQLVVGEQVEAAVAHGWLDLVSSGLEAEGYACGAVVLGAHSVGAPGSVIHEIPPAPHGLPWAEIHWQEPKGVGMVYMIRPIAAGAADCDWMSAERV